MLFKLGQAQFGKPGARVKAGIQPSTIPRSWNV